MITALLLAASQSAAPIPQTLVKQWGNRFYLYRDEKGCALYIDYDDKSMIRVAHRPAESMVYVNVVSPAWTHLKPDVGKSAAFTLFFRRGSQRYGHAAIGRVIEDADGRFGYGGANLGPDVLIDMAHEGTMGVEPFVDDKFGAPSSFDLTGVAEAASSLEHCS